MITIYLKVLSRQLPPPPKTEKPQIISLETTNSLANILELLGFWTLSITQYTRNEKTRFKN